MNQIKTTIIASFAIFSMFFGSGNLVFPLEIGARSLNNFPAAIAGLSITAILVPLLGLIGILLFQGDPKKFFAPLGRFAPFLISLSILSLLGPLAVVPRCILVAYGGIDVMLPSMPLWLFSGLFCGLIALLIWKHNQVITIIGKYLTPCLLGGIGLLIVTGIFANTPIRENPASSFDSFNSALFKGYSTMDLLAAFFFAPPTLIFIRKMIPSHSRKEATKLTLRAALIGMGLLALVYGGFLYLGAAYAPYLGGVSPEHILPTISGHVLGAFSAPIASSIIALACLTTAVVLTTLFADFAHEAIPKLNYKPAVLLTLGLAFVISLMGFSTLAGYLGKVLDILYPALIALTLANLASKVFVQRNLAKYAFWFTLVASQANCLI